MKLISKQTSIEIEQLNARVVEAETKLKTEVQRVKKKLQIHITELELSLDVANKNNIDLQKTIKKQSLTLTVISKFIFANASEMLAIVSRWIISFFRNYKLITMKYSANCKWPWTNWASVNAASNHWRPSSRTFAVITNL